MHGRLVSVLILLALVAGVSGGTLALGGCAAPTLPDSEVSEMKALEIPAIDLAQPAAFQTATFALG